MTWIALSLFAFLAWSTVLLLPWQPCRTRERLEASRWLADLSEVTALIPARNEGKVIDRTLRALLEQGDGLEVVVIDDASEDRTAEIAMKAFEDAVGAETRARKSGAAAIASTMRIIQGEPLPPGWGGKLWALEQGLAGVKRRYTLLLDADIVLAPGMLTTLLQKARMSDARLVSIMARLRCETFWERLLVPPFIFFFKLLYPFARVNNSTDATAAAAGGCIFVQTAVLRDVGAFGSIHGELIDDCALARRVKDAGHPIWLGLSLSVDSRREYRTLGEFWQMVSRTAFTQLDFSLGALLATTLLMLAVFVAPVATLAADPSPTAGPASLAALVALVVMAAAYWPVVRFYGLSLPWVLTLPLAASLYLLMTWSSALNYWRGTRATWKNRNYDTHA